MIKFEQKVGQTVRTYEVTEIQSKPNLSKHLLSRGFDGKVYLAISKPTNNQRKTYHGIFYRSAETQEFRTA